MIKENKKPGDIDILEIFEDIKLKNKNILDRDILTNIFIKYMKNTTEEELVSMLYSKFEAIVDFARLCRGEKTGQKISMLFNPHRYSTSVIKKGALMDYFKENNFLSGLARVIIWREGIVKELLYSSLHLGVNGSQIVYDFQPYVARQIYSEYDAKRILDPCAGWGGRMIGAASLGTFYHGFEPSTKTYEGLLKLGEFLKEFKNGFDYKIECLPFEDAKLTDKYDIAFTSPPYYDTELYSKEETNSCNRYKTFKDWCDGFYLPMVNKVLKHTPNFIINVGDRKYPLKTVLFDNFKVEEVLYFLNGGAGMGKKKEEEEAFYSIKLK